MTALVNVNVRDYNEYDIISRITKNNFEYYLSNEDYVNAYNKGFEDYFLYVYKSNWERYKENYAIINEMIERFDKHTDKSKQMSLTIKFILIYFGFYFFLFCLFACSFVKSVMFSDENPNVLSRIFCILSASLTA